MKLLLKAAIAATAFSLLSNPSNSLSEKGGYPPKRLSLEDLNSILLTDIDREELSSTENLWDDSSRSISSDSGSGSPNSPYIVCNTRAGQSGNRRRYALEKHFGFNLMPIYNGDDKTCFYASVANSVSEKSSFPEYFIVHSLPSHSKIGGGTSQAINHEEDGVKRINVFLSPGVATNEEESGDVGRYIILSLKDEESPSVLQWNGPMNGATSTTRKRSLMWENAVKRASLQSNLCSDILTNVHVQGTRSGASFIVNFSQDISPHKNCVMSLMAGITTFPQVISMGVKLEYFTMNMQAQWITQGGAQDERPWFDAGLTGKGQIVALSDTGIDLDNCYFQDENQNIVKDGSVDAAKRKVIQYTPFADNTDNNGHGTHVAGTIAGKKIESGVKGFNRIADGIARDAKLSFFDIGSDDKPLILPHDIELLLNPGRDAGAKIHTMSWGASFHKYGFMERSIDEYIFENENFLVITAVGNEGNYAGYNTMSTVMSPATSKNVVSVGAAQSAGIDLKQNMLGNDYLADFSSRGPSTDGRIKPEVVAPGFFILSAKPNPLKGDCDSPDGIQFLAGTSMAAAVTSGTAALIRQYFEEGWYPSGRPVPSDALSPSGALVKAVLLNGAQNLTGIQNGFNVSKLSPYDNNQGFGMINLMKSLRLDDENNTNILAVDRKAIHDGDEPHAIYLAFDDTTEKCQDAELSATLVWADPPAVPFCAKCVLNDLDLSIKRNDEIPLFPNGLDHRDELNNAERVRVEAKLGDKFVVTVAAHNLLTWKQKYSLVVTGCFVEVKGDNDADNTDHEMDDVNIF